MLNNFKTALLSIWSNKVRSVLNVLGVVIGVASVTILVSLGQGLKNDVSGLIEGLGTNVLTVTGGKVDASTGGQGGPNPAGFITGDILTKEDVADVASLPDVEHASPITVIAGSIKYEEKSASPTITGAYPSIINILSVFDIEKGVFFSKANEGKVIVLNKQGAEQLFGESNPVGKKVTLGSEQLEVVGVLSEAKNSSMFGSELNILAFVPFDTATEFNKGQEKILRINIKAKDAANVETVKDKVKETILQNHNGEEDFTVLTQEDLLGLFNTFLDLATTMVSAIAAISLLVGGIGIMNIMLVTVTERTREIGLRKAVGATKSAILVQFLVEAITVTFVGSLIGLLIAFITNIIVAAQTDLNPSITPDLIMIAVGVSVVVGLIFGLWPAIRAAQKDPIEALRYE